MESPTPVRLISKRRVLSLKEKGEIIEEVDRNPNVSKSKLAEKFSLATSTLATILGNREAILQSIAKCGASSAKRKNSRASPYQDLEEKLLDWLIERQELNLPINGLIMREQAKVIASELGCENFSASSGWIDRFKHRHGLANKALFDESVAECKIRWRTVRDTFKQSSNKNEAKSKNGKESFQKTKCTTRNYPNSSYDSSIPTQLENYNNQQWPPDYSNVQRHPQENALSQGLGSSFPKIKVEVASDEENKPDDNQQETDNSNYDYIIPNSLCDVITETPPPVQRKRTPETATEKSGGTKKRRENQVVAHRVSSAPQSDSVEGAQVESNPSEHPIETFFKSMAATVMTFPPHLMAIAKLEVCNIVTKLELRAISDRNKMDMNYMNYDGGSHQLSVENGTANISSSSCSEETASSYHQDSIYEPSCISSNVNSK